MIQAGVGISSNVNAARAGLEVGQQVEAAEVVCVIESMKIFTELRADQAGTVTKILVENEEPVMKNQELIEIEITASQTD